MKILFATSEAHPLIKTGGLADVSGSLPKAIAGLGHDVRLVMPAYQQVLEKYPQAQQVSGFHVGGAGRDLHVRVLQLQPEEIGVPVWLLDIPELFARPGNPYLAPDGVDWWDNGERFAVFSRAVAQLAMNRAGLNWQAEAVHANDWQTGLVPAFLQEEAAPPRTLFTIHNMAYAGYFPRSLFDSMWLPWHWWTPEGVEYYGQMSMLKAGIMYADFVTTVSPSYANEICTSEFAYGFAGIMRRKRAEGRLRGILNGIDTLQWNPQTDPLIPFNYSLARGRVSEKKRNKQELYRHFSITADEQLLKRPLMGFVGRLVIQKGIDLILQVVPQLLDKHDVNLVLVGSGDSYYEQALRELAASYQGRILLHIGYDEALAHLIEAGADMFLMPSRFEPCGLNQLYSLAYGTPPIVHYTGGLGDTVVNATEENLADRTATGFVFYDPSTHALRSTIEHALYLFGRPRTWQQIQRNGMSQVFDWRSSAEQYIQLFTQEL